MKALCALFSEKKANLEALTQDQICHAAETPRASARTNCMLRHEARVQNKDLMMRLVLEMRAVTEQSTK
jgi:hypothetical protein